MMFELTWKPVSSRFVSYRVIRSFSRAVWPITNQCEIPGPKAQINWQIQAIECGFLFSLIRLEPVKHLGAGDGIGHDVLPADDDRGRRIGLPNCRRNKIGRKLQSETGGIGRVISFRNVSAHTFKRVKA
jgi:hypothetical protein